MKEKRERGEREKSESERESPISENRAVVAAAFLLPSTFFTSPQLSSLPKLSPSSPPKPQGYSGVEVRVTPMRTEVIIRATRTQDVLGVKGRRIRELTAAVQKRFRFADGSVELYAEKVNSRGLCAVAQAESLRYKLLGGLAVRRACYGVLRYVMEAGAKGCEVVVSGKLRAQRAKAMKFSDG